MARFVHEHAIAGRKRVHERRFPRARTGSRKNHHRAFRPEHLFQASEHFLTKLLELGAAMVDRRPIDRAQNALGYVGRTGNLQEVAAAGVRHVSSP
jgi:hypothetical protein